MAGKGIVGMVEQDGGKILASYKEPFSEKTQYLVLLPINKIKPSPFQRDLSPNHIKRLSVVITKIGRYIDPIVVVRGKDGFYYTPNGIHRLEAMRILGRKLITAILIPDKNVADYILALNTEKTPNMREKCLEVIKLYQELVNANPAALEKDYQFQFEEPDYITMGLIYLEERKFNGATYHPILRKIDRFLALPIKQAIDERRKRAERLKKLNELVLKIEEQFERYNVKFPFIKQYIMSRVNPYKYQREVADDFYMAIDKIEDNLRNLKPEEISTSAMFDIEEYIS